MTNLHRHAPLRVALVGLGTVGGGVIRLLNTNGDLIARRAGCPIQIVAISARDRNKDRGVDLTRFAWVDDTTALAQQADVDVVVELIGGSDGPALTLARSTLAAGKSFVTANKAMLAHHGFELATAAEAARVALKFEAAVAGGIPVIMLRSDGGMNPDGVRDYDLLVPATAEALVTERHAADRDEYGRRAAAWRDAFAEAAESRPR